MATLAARTDALVAALPRTTLYEFSVRLAPGRLDRWGRFGGWVVGDAADAFEPIVDWLVEHGAPADVITAQADAIRPERQGAAVAIVDAVPEFRLYLHGRDAETGKPTYRAWRWHRNGPARSATYHFHFAPEGPEGERPEALVPDWASAGVAALATEPLVRRSSGFWLRTDATGAIDQVDLAFPWAPRADTLDGLAALVDRSALLAEDTAWVDALPVRHVAVQASATRPGATLYTAATLTEPPPDEAGLQAAVIAAARRESAVLQFALAGLPAPISESADRQALDTFYSGAIAVWRQVLGEEMHYHHGLFPSGVRHPDDAAMLAASRRAVSELYPFIPAGARVYDIGCGWGGPLAMLARERGCRALGLTIARGQFRHVAALGLPVRWGDAETTLPPGRFDVALLLESFEHMADKPRLLATLAPFVDRLVMRVNCQDDAPPGTRFGDTMHMVSSATLRAMLEAGGWRIVAWRDRRAEAMPAVAAWGRRLAALGPTDDRHLEIHRAWCLRLLLLGDAWAQRNPLIEVVADRVR